MAIHWKLRNERHFRQILCNESSSLSVADIKKKITEELQLKVSYVKLHDPQTDDEYTDDNEQLPRGTTVIAGRVALPRQKKRHRPREIENTTPIQLPSRVPASRTLNEVIKSSNIATSTASESEKVKAILAHSTDDYDPSRFTKVRGGNSGPLPPEYVCYRCNKGGHHIKDCPTNNSKAKRSTGIPRSFMIPASADQKGALLTSTGDYAVPWIEYLAYTEKNDDKPSSFPQTESNATREEEGRPDDDEADEIPDELKCTFCHNLLTDAVFSPCCVEAFCDECLRFELLDSDPPQCPSCQEEGISIEHIIPVLRLRKAVKKFLDRESTPQPSQASVDSKSNPETDENSHDVDLNVENIIKNEEVDNESCIPDIDDKAPQPVDPSSMETTPLNNSEEYVPETLDAFPSEVDSPGQSGSPTDLLTKPTEAGDQIEMKDSFKKMDTSSPKESKDTPESSTSDQAMESAEQTEMSKSTDDKESARISPVNQTGDDTVGANQEPKNPTSDSASSSEAIHSGIEGMSEQDDIKNEYSIEQHPSDFYFPRSQRQPYNVKNTIRPIVPNVPTPVGFNRFAMLGPPPPRPMFPNPPMPPNPRFSRHPMRPFFMPGPLGFNPQMRPHPGFVSPYGFMGPQASQYPPVSTPGLISGYDSSQEPYRDKRYSNSPDDEEYDRFVKQLNSRNEKESSHHGDRSSSHRDRLDRKRREKDRDRDSKRDDRDRGRDREKKEKREKERKKEKTSRDKRDRSKDRSSQSDQVKSREKEKSSRDKERKKDKSREKSREKERDEKSKNQDSKDSRGRKEKDREKDRERKRDRKERSRAGE